jgi:2'-5' RNA ligase
MAATAIVVLVPELEALVGTWYRRHSEAGRRGLPPHLTLYPFVAAEELGENTAAEIGSALAPFKPFRLTLAETRRFVGEPATLYLHPEPSEPFVAMTEALTAAFPSQPPYGGVFDEIVPHLTVAQGEPELLDSIETEVAALLPIAVRVERAWLAVDTADGWRRHSAFPLL